MERGSSLSTAKPEEIVAVAGLARVQFQVPILNLYDFKVLRCRMAEVLFAGRFKKSCENR
jgi:hypothetical protein